MSKIKKITLVQGLVLMPVGVDIGSSNNPPAAAKASFLVWNENEIQFTTMSRCITGWDQKLVSSYAAPDFFLRSMLQTDAGRARVDGVQSASCASSGNFPLVGTVAKRLDLDIGVTVSSAAGTTIAGEGLENAIILETLCISDVQCDDASACTCDVCNSGVCQSTNVEFGNVDCSANATPNLDDILCVLRGFAGVADCPNGDIAPAGPVSGCQGDNVINLDDILAVIGAFGGANPCGCNP